MLHHKPRAGMTRPSNIEAPSKQIDAHTAHYYFFFFPPLFLPVWARSLPATLLTFLGVFGLASNLPASDASLGLVGIIDLLGYEHQFDYTKFTVV